MKSLKQLPGRIRSCLMASVLICTCVLFLNSCQKDDLIHPSGSLSNVNEKSAAGPQIPIYETIKIDHQGVRGTAPDYVVIVRTDKNVEFIGRRNVAVTGITFFKIDELTLNELRNNFLLAHFFQIIDKPPYIADAPPTYTTFNDGISSRTLVDYNNGVPQELVTLRVKTEQLLNLAPYIYGISAEQTQNRDIH